MEVKVDENKPIGQGDQHFDKKLLLFAFLVVLACLIAVYLSPNVDAISQNSMVTVLTGALTTLLGGIITLTSGRSSQRSVDTQQIDSKPPVTKTDTSVISSNT